MCWYQIPWQILPSLFFNPCLCTILSIVCQKWNASARRESSTEGDYAITVFTSTSFLSLFWVLLCVKLPTSSSRSFFSLRGSKIEWVWETDKQEESSTGKCCKPGPQGAQPYQDYHKTEKLCFSCPRLRCAEPCRWSFDWHLLPAALLACGSSRAGTAPQPWLLVMKGRSLGTPLICSRNSL